MQDGPTRRCQIAPVIPALEMVAVSDRGRVRAHNEDCVAVRPAAGLALLADGMGGHNAGEVASAMAVELIGEAIVALPLAELALSPERARELIGREVARANAEIHAAGASRREYGGMGTTLVVALWHGEWLSAGHVGDSRLYRLRGGALTQLTRDHTLVQAYVDAGTLSRERARTSAARNILTRALGTEPDVEVDLETFEVAPGDLYLLCSDGLTEMVPDRDIERVLGDIEANLDDAAAELVSRANANGGVDNVSVVLARAGATDSREREPS